MVEPTQMDENVSVEAILEEVATKQEQTEKELKEIDLLIQQSAAEVERLAQRNAQVANYVQQLQTNFDTVPREDIREAYEALNSAQQRLYTMRGQLEKLQSDQRNLERLAETQRLFVDTAQNFGALPARSMGGNAGIQSSGDLSDVIRVIRAQEGRAPKPCASYARWTSIFS